MSIVLGRADCRLLYSVMATTWAPQFGVQWVMVIGDRIVNNPIIKESMRLGKPAGMTCLIITGETAVRNFKAGRYDDHKVFMMCEGPGVLLRLQEAGQRIPRTAIGVTRDRNSGTKASPRTLVKDEEKPVYKKLMENRCEVDVQLITTGKVVKLSHVMKL